MISREQTAPEQPASLASLTARPYRRSIASAVSPASVVAALASPADQSGRRSHGVLWGHWFGGGVLIFNRPLKTLVPRTASDGFAALDDLPRIEAPSAAEATDIVGGGWLACLGFEPGTSHLACYDSLLRWRPGLGWSFESLGIVGQQERDDRAYAGWVDALAAAAEVAGPVGATVPIESAPPIRFGVLGDPQRVRDRYLATVEEVVGRIHRGEFYQLNLCIRLHAECGDAPAALFGRMADRLQPSYGGLIGRVGERGEPLAVASFSPELFLTVRDGQVLTAPIKGTAPRRAGEKDSAALRASAKDAAENVMIVDLMRNDLSRVSVPGTVAVEELLGLEPHPGVWHLVSTVTGQLEAGTTMSGLLDAVFPPGSVTGAPKRAACRAISELEPEPRGAYTGSLGLVSPCAGAEFNVLIRGFEVVGGRIQLGVGGGITVDSVPIREWYECVHKAAPLIAAAGGDLDPALADEPASPPVDLVGAGVFESVLVRRGAPLRLAAHLARLDLSCRELYGRGLPDDVTVRVADLVARQPPADRTAVRIEARRGGDRLGLELTARVLPPRPTASTLRLGQRVNRSWRHKWVDRGSLEAAAAAAAPDLPYFSSGAPGGAGWLSEVDRGNLFLLDEKGTWRTPLLDEGLLPGVTRREVIDLLDQQGVPIVISRCTVAGLRRAQGAFWTSSLSGAVPIHRVDGRPLPDQTAFVAELNRQLGTD